MLASYYQSCYRDLEKRHDIHYFVSRFVETTGLSWEVFVAKEDNRELVDVLIAMTARFDVSPLFKLVTLDMRHSFAIAPLNRSELLTQIQMTKILATAVRSLGRGVGKEVAKRAALVHRELLVEFGKNDSTDANLLGRAADILPELGVGSAESWIDAVERHTRESLNATLESPVKLESPKLLRSLLQVLFSADTSARSLYLYAHGVHAVMWVFELNSNVNGDTDVAGKACLHRLDVKELSAVRRAFLVSTLASEHTVSAVKDMLSQVTLQVIKQVSISRRLKANTRILLSRSLRPYSYKTVFSGPYANLSRLEEAYKTFPRKMNLYQDNLWHARFVEPGELLDECLGKAVLADFHNEMCLSPFVLLPPMYYPGADRFFNYASLGFVMASRIVHAFLASTTRTKEENDAVSSLLISAAHCQNISKDIEHEGEVIDATSFVLGLRSALEAYRVWASSSSIAVDRPELYRTFFRRACLTVCSSSSSLQPYGSERFVSRAACNVAVRSMPEFYVAFHCQIGGQMSRNGICTFF